jgi:hypothetical protein
MPVEAHSDKEVTRKEDKKQKQAAQEKKSTVAVAEMDKKQHQADHEKKAAVAVEKMEKKQEKKRKRSEQEAQIRLLIEAEIITKEKKEKDAWWAQKQKEKEDRKQRRIEEEAQGNFHWNQWKEYVHEQAYLGWDHMRFYEWMKLDGDTKQSLLNDAPN